MKNIKFFNEIFDFMLVTKNCYYVVTFYVKPYLLLMKRDRLARFAAAVAAEEGDDLKDVLEVGGEAIGL